MVYSWEVSKLAQSEQLIKLMEYYAVKGNLDLGKKIARKLILSDLQRLDELSKAEVTSDNYNDVMAELIAIKARNRI